VLCLGEQGGGASLLLSIMCHSLPLLFAVLLVFVGLVYPARLEMHQKAAGGRMKKCAMWCAWWVLAASGGLLYGADGASTEASSCVFVAKGLNAAARDADDTAFNAHFIAFLRSWCWNSGIPLVEAHILTLEQYEEMVHSTVCLAIARKYLSPHLTSYYQYYVTPNIYADNQEIGMLLKLDDAGRLHAKGTIQFLKNVVMHFGLRQALEQGIQQRTPAICFALGIEYLTKEASPASFQKRELRLPSWKEPLMAAEIKKDADGNLLIRPVRASSDGSCRPHEALEIEKSKC